MTLPRVRRGILGGGTEYIGKNEESLQFTIEFEPSAKTDGFSNLEVGGHRISVAVRQFTVFFEFEVQG